MSAEARPIRTAAILRAIRAPELERFLSRREVDLLVTDQIESLKVRVAKGLEVLERKARDGIRAGRRRITLLVMTLAAGLLLPAAHWVLLERGGLPADRSAALILSAIAAGALLLALFAGIKLVIVLGDMAQLARTGARHRGRLESATTQEQVLDLAEAALADARALGALPPA